MPLPLPAPPSRRARPLARPTRVTQGGGGVALVVRARGGAYEHSAPSDDGDECVVLAGSGGGDAAAPPMVHAVACVRYNGNVGGRRREATHV